MNTSILLTAPAILLGLAVGPARAEGNGEPFPPYAAPRLSTGHAFSDDTGSAGYPQLTGEVTCNWDYQQVLVANSNEAPIQTANSLPGRTVPATAFAEAGVRTR